MECNLGGQSHKFAVFFINILNPYGVYYRIPLEVNLPRILFVFTQHGHWTRASR